MSSRPIDPQNDSARVARIVAAQWKLRAIAKGKPPRIRDAAMTAISGLRIIGRGYGSPHTYRAVAENIERLKKR